MRECYDKEKWLLFWTQITFGVGIFAKNRYFGSQITIFWQKETCTQDSEILVGKKVMALTMSIHSDTEACCTDFIIIIEQKSVDQPKIVYTLLTRKKKEVEEKIDR